MGKFDGWLICSDFDGTLYVDKKISVEDCEAIRFFQSEGGLFSFASGRFADMLDDMAVGVTSNAPAAALNGAVINGLPDPDGKRPALYRGGIDRDTAARICFDFYDHIPGVTRIVFYTWEGSVDVRRTDDPPTDRKELIGSLPAVLSKAAVYLTAEDAEEMFAEIRKTAEKYYSVTRSWLRCVEFNAPEDTKGCAVKRIKEMTGAEHLVCIGDYDNDVDMIRAADIGYAVGDASKSLLAAADRVTVPAREHAVAAMIAELERKDL
ncbi:MAG: HAD family hydrolase [Clostridia bacterium]|nr:HAD family hydrolase [Clostridia bacterium]